MNPELEKTTSIDGVVRVAQIIKFGLVSGVLTFGAYVMFLAPQPQVPDRGDMPGRGDMMVVWVMVALGVTVVVARLLVPALIVRSALQQLVVGTWQPPAPGTTFPQDDESRLAALYQTQMLIGSALIEGGAFANLAACMLYGHLISWIVSAGLLVALIVDFPTKSSVHAWIAAKMTQLRDERHLAGRPS